MKFLSELYIQRGSLLQFSGMAQSNKWWIVCVVAIACVAGFGSCRSGRQDGAQPGAFIFNELCALKDEPGPCKAIKDRFFFNIDRGQCELFEYGGCGGNANNFETLEECEETCVVSEDKNPCHLGEAPGPCRGLVTRYFFDSTNQQCRSFFYGGCFGNANNFRSMADCQAKCQNPVKTTRAPQVYTQAARNPASAQPTITTGQLTIREPRVQLNNTHQETHELNPINVCLGPILKGTCDGAEKRFAYNAESKRCQSFHYSGCGGNENNFKYRKNCIKKCIREARGMIRVRRKNLDSIAQRSV